MQDTRQKLPYLTKLSNQSMPHASLHGGAEYIS